MYGDESDWSWRARHAGLTMVWSAAARVLHHGGASGEELRGEVFVKNLEACPASCDTIAVSGAPHSCAK